MILIDFSQVLHANLHQANKEGLDISTVRGNVLISLLSYKKKFSHEYGPPVLAIDANGGYWRKDIFPHYKATRAKAREKQKDKVDWVLFKKIANTITEEVKLALPWKTIHVERVEGDDIIAVLASIFQDKPTLILSSDKDFKQLHHGKVKQYSPIMGRWISCDSPHKELHDLILSGDSIDGIPNIKSPEDCLMEGIRQTAVTQKFKDACWADMGLLEEYRERYELNKRLIDLREIPDEIRESIINAYQEPIKGTPQRLMYYFQAKKLNLINEVQDFLVRKDSYDEIHAGHRLFT